MNETCASMVKDFTVWMDSESGPAEFRLTRIPAFPSYVLVLIFHLQKQAPLLQDEKKASSEARSV